jgi:hypothetical protein
MSTRLYLNPSVGSLLFPAYDTGYWSTTGAGVRYGGSENRAPLPAATKALAESSASRGSPLLLQFIVPNLAAQTISGTVKGQIRAMQSDAGSDSFLLFNLRVVAADGTERGSLYESADVAGTTVSGTPGDATYELETSATNRKLPPGWGGSGASISSLAVSDYDNLVIEVGYRHVNTVSTTYTTTLYVGSDSASTDLPEDETETADYWPWVELSHTLLRTTEIWDNDAESFFYGGSSGGAAVPTTGQIWPRGSSA